jgi:hypothetical protein
MPTPPFGCLLQGFLLGNAMITSIGILRRSIHSDQDKADEET